MIYLIPIMPTIHFGPHDPPWFRYTMAAILLAYAIVMISGAIMILRRK